MTDKRYLVEVIYSNSTPTRGLVIERRFDHWLAAQRFADSHKDEGAETFVWDTEQD